MKYYIGIDLGGTFIKAGVVDENCKVVAKASIPSAVDGNDEALADRMVECARKALAELNLTIDDIESVGVGTPGAVDVKTGTVIYSCNLQFENTPLARYVQKSGFTRRFIWKTTPMWRLTEKPSQALPKASAM